MKIEAKKQKQKKRSVSFRVTEKAYRNLVAVSKLTKRSQADIVEEVLSHLR